MSSFLADHTPRQPLPRYFRTKVGPADVLDKPAPALFLEEESRFNEADPLRWRPQRAHDGLGLRQRRRAGAAGWLAFLFSRVGRQPSRSSRLPWSGFCHRRSRYWPRSVRCLWRASSDVVKVLAQQPDGPRPCSSSSRLSCRRLLCWDFCSTPFAALASYIVGHDVASPCSARWRGIPSRRSPVNSL